MNWSYIAGYFDGEGSVNRGRRQRSLSWFNTHLASLVAMRDFMGCGNIYGRPHHGGLGRTPMLRVVRTNG